MIAREEFDKLVQRYLDQQTTKEESAFVESYLSEATHAEAESEEPLLNLASDRTSRMLFAIEEGIERRSRVIPYKPLRWIAAGIAASIVCSITWVILSNSPRPGQEKLFSIRSKKAEQYKITLGDGSSVWLNAESRLRYPTQFSSSRRDVFLEGEAYFEVAHDKRRPFRVYSGSLVTEVLGTHFNVKAYPRENVKVTLLEGKVMLTAPKLAYNRRLDTLFLKPGEQARYSPTKERSSKDLSRTSSAELKPIVRTALVKQHVTAADEASWRDGSLTFDNETLGSVMESVSRHYNVDVNVASVLKQRQITVKISGVSAEEALQAVCRVVNRKYQAGRAKFDDLVQVKKVGASYYME